MADSAKKKTIECQICGLVVPSLPAQRFKNHMEIHSGIRPYKCEYCEKAFTLKSNLTTHLRIHTGEKPFKCDLCGTRFTQSSQLTKHMLTHTGARPFKCEFCEKTFAQKTSLKHHKNLHHTRENLLKCEAVELDQLQ